MKSIRSKKRSKPKSGKKGKPKTPKVDLPAVLGHHKKSIENLGYLYHELEGEYKYMDRELQSMSAYFRMALEGVNKFIRDVEELKAEVKSMRPWRPTDASLTYEEMIDEISKLRGAVYGRNDH